MVRWNLAFLKIALVLGAFAMPLVASGAALRWE